MHSERFIPPDGAMQFEIAVKRTKASDYLPAPPNTPAPKFLWVMPPTLNSTGCGCVKAYPIVLDSLPYVWRKCVSSRPNAIAVVCECQGRIIE